MLKSKELKKRCVAKKRIVSSVWEAVFCWDGICLVPVWGTQTAPNQPVRQGLTPPARRTRVFTWGQRIPVDSFALLGTASQHYAFRTVGEGGQGDR